MGGCDRWVIVPELIHEVFQDEVIIADLGRGIYYSLNGSGIDIWTGLDHGLPVTDIAAAIAGNSGADEATVRSGIEQTIAELQAEALIRPQNGEPPAPPSGQPRFVSTSYQPATLAKFTDMEHMLMLDPIHDVDESGWPNLPEEL